MEVATQINVDKLTNNQILNLENDGATDMDVVEKQILDSYFGEYLSLTKAYRTQGVLDLFPQRSGQILVRGCLHEPKDLLYAEKQGGVYYSNIQRE